VKLADYKGILRIVYGKFLKKMPECLTKRMKYTPRDGSKKTAAEKRAAGKK